MANPRVLVPPNQMQSDSPTLGRYGQAKPHGQRARLDGRNTFYRSLDGAKKHGGHSSPRAREGQGLDRPFRHSET